MLRSFRFMAVACVFGALQNTAALAQSCSLKREQVAGSPGCFGFVGYSGGQRVGFFRSRGTLVTTGKGCPAEYLHGSLVSSNAINVGGSIRTLSPDCRSSL